MRALRRAPQEASLDIRPHRSLALPFALVLAVQALVLQGCPRPSRQTGGAAVTEGQSPPSAAHPATQLGVGDLFEVRVFQEAELSGVYRVGPDGTIDFPFCGRLHVEGQTSSDLASRLKDCLAQGYLRNPQVTVVSKEFNSKKISVFGYVQKPGTFGFEDNMSIIQAITLAGGFAQFAGQNATTVIRVTDAGVEQKFKVRVQDIGLGQAANFYLQPGDIIYVPESPF